MTENTRVASLAATYDDLQIVGEVVTLRFAPGSGEADRIAHVRKLLEVTADLNYAISTYTHRVLMFAGRRPAAGDLRDETTALQDALDAFDEHVRAMADAYRRSVTVPCPGDR
jgi:gas vesicle protein